MILLKDFCCLSDADLSVPDGMIEEAQAMGMYQMNVHQLVQILLKKEMTINGLVRRLYHANLQTQHFRIQLERAKLEIGKDRIRFPPTRLYDSHTATFMFSDRTKEGIEATNDYIELHQGHITQEIHPAATNQLSCSPTKENLNISNTLKKKRQEKSHCGSKPFPYVSSRTPYITSTGEHEPNLKKHERKVDLALWQEDPLHPMQRFSFLQAEDLNDDDSIMYNVSDNEQECTSSTTTTTALDFDSKKFHSETKVFGKTPLESDIPAMFLEPASASTLMQCESEYVTPRSLRNLRQKYQGVVEDRSILRRQLETVLQKIQQKNKDQEEVAIQSYEYHRHYSGSKLEHTLALSNSINSDIATLDSLSIQSSPLIIPLGSVFTK
jgi:hypothetical protein